MHVVALIGGLFLIVTVSWDAFVTIILPRRVSSNLWLARLYFAVIWSGWRALGDRFRGRWREGVLGLYGPMSLVSLFALWALLLVGGFGVLQWGIGARLVRSGQPPGFGTYIYMSGVTFFTLGYGDVVPTTTWGRVVAVIEAGAGFALVSIVISYLPSLITAFSRREVSMVIFDARAHRPPVAATVLRRTRSDHGALRRALEARERWAAQVQVDHLAYPVVMYYRSLRQGQSWVATLTVTLDLCALLLSGVVENTAGEITEEVFDVACETARELSTRQRLSPRVPHRHSMDQTTLARLRAFLASDHIPVHDDAESLANLSHLRQEYEPSVAALAEHLCMPLPPWLPEDTRTDDHHDLSKPRGTSNTNRAAGGNDPTAGGYPRMDHSRADHERPESSSAQEVGT